MSSPAARRALRWVAFVIVAALAGIAAAVFTFAAPRPWQAYAGGVLAAETVVALAAVFVTLRARLGALTALAAAACAAALVGALVAATSGSCLDLACTTTQAAGGARAGILAVVAVVVFAAPPVLVVKLAQRIVRRRG
jgi:hypothetical protein